MKRLVFLLFAVGFGVSVVTPSVAPVAHADLITTPAQKRALRRLASIIRRGKTAKVVRQVVDLIDEAIAEVDAAGDTQKNLFFRNALQQLRNAAELKAKGLEQNNGALLNAAEDAIQKALAYAKA